MQTQQASSQQVEQLIGEINHKIIDNAEQVTQATQASNQIMHVVDDFNDLSDWFKR